MFKDVSWILSENCETITKAHLAPKTADHSSLNKNRLTHV